MPIHKIIFRLDFVKPCFDVIDKPGTVMKSLNDMGADFWQGFRDAPANRTIIAEFTDEEKGLHRSMTLEPTTFNFSIESKKGFVFSSIQSDPTFTTMIGSLGNFLTQFNTAKQILRSGIRLVYLGNIDSPNINSPYLNTLGEELNGRIAKSIGNPDDYALVFDGGHEDGLKYHLKFGPIVPSQYQKFLKNVGHHIASESNPNFLCDIDLYEENFALSVKPIVWTKIPIQKSNVLINDLEGFLQSKI